MYILASDFDGTLTQHGTVSDKDKAAIVAWRKAGNLFGVNTGRGYSGIKAELEHHQVDYDYLLCNNGGLIYENEAKPIEQKTADGVVLPSLVSLILNSGGFHASIGRIEYNCEINYWISEHMDRKPGPEFTRITISDLNEITYFTQLSTQYEKEEQANKCAQQINELFGDSVTAFQNGVCIDIVPAGVNKATGLLRYIHLKQVPKENVLVIGDNFNDLDMILEFNGFSVDSGRSEVIAIARKSFESIAGLIDEYI
ncbi:MAG: HAD-superfamily hydrolase, subfamily [Bacillota bacterium]|jgi:HAD superfamily hydrolase (TIGR01484 family)|nr:HAD-superfamily hydrolase, subfamily [Bacillota bacterium]